MSSCLLTCLFISGFREMLQLGKRKPWPEALEILTNKRTMDVGPMKEYFWPLYLWLRKKRCSSKYRIGWSKNTGPGDDPCVEPTTLPDTEVGMTPPNTRVNSKAHAQSSSAAQKLTLTVFAVLICLNFQLTLWSLFRVSESYIPKNGRRIFSLCLQLGKIFSLRRGVGFKI